VFWIWIPITVAAAFLQCMRTALQKRLVAPIGTDAANFVRYLYGAPLAALMLAGMLTFGDEALPTPGLRFYVMAGIGGLAQIVATTCLIIAFTLRDFAVGTTLSKTETVQTALMATVFLAEPLGMIAWVAILVSLGGVLLLSLPARIGGLASIVHGLTEKAALFGLAAGGLFGLSAIGIRGASLSLPEGGFFLRAMLTLAFITAFQSVVMGSWLAWRDRAALARTVRLWRQAAPVGLLSVVGSAGWFTAMTLQNAAYVRAVGQVELIFTLIVSRYGFGERPSRRELTGIALVAGGVIVLLIGR
jgi:drug/metabolite transporter (DMT)-like permease